MEIKSSARFIRTAPDKIRILSGLVKGKTLETAINQLTLSGRAAAHPVILVLKQLKAQIKDKEANETDFIVKEIRVDEGPKLKRRRIRHQGRATAILKRMSHVSIIVKDSFDTEEKVKVLKEETVKNKKQIVKSTLKQVAPKTRKAKSVKGVSHGS